MFKQQCLIARFQNSSLHNRLPPSPKSFTYLEIKTCSFDSVAISNYFGGNHKTKLSIFLFRPFSTLTQKRLIMIHLPSMNFQTVFCVVLFVFFKIITWVLKPYIPPHTFPFQSPLPALGFRTQSEHLKIDVWFLSMLGEGILYFIGLFCCQAFI